MTEKVLLDTGPSERGWSYWGDAFRCMHLFALKRLGGYSDVGDPLIRGSLGHVGLAHFYARWMAKQNREDPDIFYEPEEALWQWSLRHPEGQPHLQRMNECVRRYIAKYPEPPGRILGVEHPLCGVVGYLEDGRFGLWALPVGEIVRLSWRYGDPWPRAAVGQLVSPATVNMPGAPQHGEPIIVTKRFDLTIADKAGRIYVWDHKCTASDVSSARERKYRMDGQFAVTRILASQVYGERFAQATLNLVQTEEPWKVVRPTIQPTPWRDALFPRMVLKKAHDIAQATRDEPNPHFWEMAQHELACWHRYGACPFLETPLCSHGPS